MTPIFTPMIAHRSVRDQVYEALKEQIIALTILPGTALSENEMAIQFAVSRTPIRESFVRLAQEGLVQVLPQRGTLVSLIDRELVEEARFMRNQLESAVVELACESIAQDTVVQLELNLQQQKLILQQESVDQMFKLDQQFHALLFAGVHKTNTWNTMSLLTAHLDRSRKLRLLDNYDWRQIYMQHIEILEAIKKHDAKTAKAIMHEHIARGKDDMAALHEKYPHYFV
ncbi:MAG TPA: GntR family transcriptional regulator [Ureibacillus sp.]|nr:GntR family transcriptional regulator [Ureibacillus sp.]